MRIAAVLFALAFALPAAAQDRTIKFLVGFPAGASLDTMTRVIADHMRSSLKQPVVVENRPGAGGQIAMTALKGSAPDGLTLVMTPLVTVVTAPHFQALPYDPFADFAPVSHTANFHFAFAANAQAQVRTLAEYVALVKRDPKAGNYSSAAPGSLPHFFSLMFADKASLPAMNHIGYKGTAQAMTDLLGGQITAFMGVVSDLVPQHRAGKVFVLATSGAVRARDLPDVPTFKELGYDIEGAGWYAAYAPAGTPKETVDRLSAAIGEAIRAPEVRTKLEAMGMEPTGTSAAELARIHKRDYDQWGPVIKASGFKPGS
jgi:tripartite-type tricarboxylate transporter receptor subunit TctC